MTTGTLFSSRKLPLQTCLCLVALFAAAAKGISSLQLARNLGVEQKTAYLLQQKLRREILVCQQGIRLSGDVEVDGAVFGGYRYASNTIRTASRKRYYRRRGVRKVVVVARERGGKTRTVVVDRESEAIFALKGFIEPTATVHADGAHAWDSLNDLYRLLRIHHNISYSNGVSCTNQAESYFSRLRRVHIGTHHRIGGPNLPLYAAETAWREDNRRLSVEDATKALLEVALRGYQDEVESGLEKRQAA